MAWIYLIIAGVFEIVWAVGLKYCDGFKLNIPLGIVISAMALSVFFLVLAMRQIPIGTAYAVWTGIGVIGVTSLGMLLFNESASFSRLLYLGLIFIGILGLKLCKNN